MKKIVSLGFVILFCLTALFGAAGGEELPPEQIVLKSGDILEVDVKITAEAAGLQAQIAWDPAQLMLTGDAPAYAADFKKGSMIAMINPDTEAGTLTLVYLRQKNLSVQDAQVLPLTFCVAEGAVSGEAEIAIRELQMVDQDNSGVEASAEGLTVMVEGAEAEPAATTEATAEPTATPVPAAARLYLEVKPAPEATEEPASVPTEEPTATPEPAPTPTRPSGHISGGSTVTQTAAPTATPEVTPTATVPTVVIGGATEAPKDALVDGGNVILRVKPADGGVCVELIARDCLIGGLQAEILYDAEDAALVQAAFSEAFAKNAMVQMINDTVPGKISLVYSNLSGYEADGSAIFSAQLLTDGAESPVFTLTNAKYTGIGADMEITQIGVQRAQWAIQPEDDLTVIEEDGVRIVEIEAGSSFALTVNPGEVFALRIRDQQIPGVYWSAEGESITVSAEGLVQAHESGLVMLSAVSVQDGSPLAEGRVCVRNAQFGIPMEVLEISYGDGAGDIMALSAETDEEAYAARGIELLFRDGDRLLHVRGLLPEDMTSIPEEAFALCGNLAEADISAANIEVIEAGAFRENDSLEKIVLRNPAAEIQDGALPADGDCTLCILAESGLIEWAARNEIPFSIIEEAGDEQ